MNFLKGPTVIPRQRLSSRRLTIIITSILLRIVDMVSQVTALGFFEGCFLYGMCSDSGVYLYL